MTYRTETRCGAVGVSIKLSADFSTSKFLRGVQEPEGLMVRYFNPAEEVLPEQIITGVGCSAGTFHMGSRRKSNDDTVLDQLFHTLMDEGEAVLIAAP